MSLEIRVAVPDDAQTIFELIRGLAEYEKEPQAVEVTPAILRAQMESAQPPFECLIAFWAGTPVGFALYFQNYSTWKGRPGMYLEDLFVQPSARGHGVGKALLVLLAKICAERGYGRFEWAVLDWNAPAIGFYKKLGARPMDEWTVFRLTGESLHDLAKVSEAQSPQSKSP
ncbi:MAG: GNAT family N-acetyltransferase [Planctomycetota bacterium]|nr:GNAT family N-acetyltransferase [Planctomycetota bacterium]